MRNLINRLSIVRSSMLVAFCLLAAYAILSLPHGSWYTSAAVSSVLRNGPTAQSTPGPLSASTVDDSPLLEDGEIAGREFGDKDIVSVPPSSQASRAPNVTFVVNTTADTQDAIPGNGVCADAGGACSLRAAITEANASAGADIVTLPAGTYTVTLTGGSENNNASGDFDLNTEITINGAGSGTTIVQAAATRNTATERVFHLRAAFVMALNDMTIRYGRYTTAASTFGAGVRVDTAAVNATLTNVVVTENDNGTSGGGIAVSSSNGATLTLNNCTVSNNTAGGTAAGSSTGAGIMGNNATSTININNSTVTGNTVSNSSTTIPASAGGVSTIGTLNITDSMVTNNTATSSGSNTFSGGVHVTAGTTTITGSTISGNMSTVTAGVGAGFAGGIYNQQATVNISGSTISGNSASSFHGGIRTLASTTAAASTTITESTVSGNTSVGEGGGVINIAGSTLNANTNIIRSTVSGNMATSATSLGGGVENFTVSTGLGVVNLFNSTISGNTANTGAGVYNSGAAAAVNANFSTVASNAATTNGGGLFQDASGVTNLKNSVVGDNTAPSGPDIFGTITSQNYNHVENTTGGTFTPLAGDATGTDALLGALAANGGPTLTHLPGAASPVLNTIPNATNDCGVAPFDMDQRAFARPAETGCEKGSVEQTLPPGSMFTLTTAVAGTGTGTITGAGINCPGDCTEDFAPATMVALTPAAGGGSTFTGWSGACTGNGACNVTMNSAKSVTATFSLPVVCSAPATFATNTALPAPIPDNGPAGVTLNVPVAGQVNVVQDLRVNLTLDQPAGGGGHTWVGDLIGNVTSPAPSSTHLLFSRVGSTSGTGAGDSSDLQGPYTFHDGAAGDLWMTAGVLVGGTIPAGEYRTQACCAPAVAGPGINTEMNGAFAGLAPNGTWTFNIADNAAGDTGRVSAMSLTMSTCPTVTPTFSKNFVPDTVAVAQVSTLTFTVDNAANAVQAVDVDFTDNLPAGVVVAPVPNASTTCAAGTIGATAGSGVISFMNGRVPASALCTVQVNVVSSTAGAHVNTTGDLTSRLGNSGTATDTLTVGAGGAPEIDVLGNGISIADGDTTPSAGDHTDFGSATVHPGTVTRTFTIENTGTADLTLSNPTITGANAGDFAVTASPVSPVTAGNSTTFQVTFDPSNPGLRTATVNIVNDDADENPYDFAIQGTGTPVIDGAAGGDTFVVSCSGGNTTVTVNATPVMNFPTGSFSPLTINGNAGNDTLTVDFANCNPAPAGGIFFNGGSDTDSMTLQGGNFASSMHTPSSANDGVVQLAGGTTGAATITFTGLEPVTDTTVAASITINGTAAVDTINIIDGPAGTTQVNSGAVPTFELVNFANKTNATVNGLNGNDIVTVSTATASAGLAMITVNGDNNNDVVNINVVPGGISVNANTGAGDDAINLAPAGMSLDNIGGPVTANGGTENDIVTVNDQNNPFGDTFTVTSTTVTRLFFGGLTYGTVEGLIINAQNVGNITNISSTAVGTPVTVNAGAGNDAVNLTPVSMNLDNIDGAVTVNGGTENDTVTLNDQNNPFGDTFTVTSTTVNRSFFAGLTYETVEGVTLNAQDTANNTTNINSTAAGTPFTINAGGGNDTVNVGDGTLDNLLGSVNVNGDAETAADSLVVNDSTDTTSNTYTVTPTAVTRSGGVTINYTTIEALTVTGGVEADTFNITPAPNGAPLAMTMNGGPPITFGDVPNIDMTGVTGGVVAINPMGTGTFTSTSHQTIDLTGFEPGGPTITTVASNNNPSIFGENVSFTATVASTPPGFGTPTGTVTFNIDGNLYCVNTPLNGSQQATCTVAGLPALPAGNRVVVAIYNGDMNFLTSAGSLAGGQVVNMADTTTTITSDLPDPSLVNQPYTVTWTVVPNPVQVNSGSPTGTVTIDGGVGGGTCSADVAIGSCQLTPTTVGVKTIQATYSGDANFNGSVSATTTHNVNLSITGTVRNGLTNAPVSGHPVYLYQLPGGPSLGSTATNASGVYTF
ncbi:MAG: choice-of-anchor D domain-containing protein, partial [Pyrinomonadaceae bacterium]